MILDLGCGTAKHPGAVGVDVLPLPGVDVVHDLQSLPYPFEDSCADEIRLDNVLEHLPDAVGTMTEIHRIGRPGAAVIIDVPYFRSHYAFIDPTHVHQFTTLSFAYFDPTHPFCERFPYSPARFAVERVTFDERLPGGMARRAVRRFANARPLEYEMRFSHLYPLDELRFRLRIVKADAPQQ